MKRHAPEQYLNYKRHQREAQARYRAKLKARRHMALSMVHAMSTFRHALHARGGGGQMSRRTHNQLYREYLKRHKPDQYLRYKKQQKEACQRYLQLRPNAFIQHPGRSGSLSEPSEQSSKLEKRLYRERLKRHRPEQYLVLKQRQKEASRSASMFQPVTAARSGEYDADVDAETQGVSVLADGTGGDRGIERIAIDERANPDLFRAKRNEVMRRRGRSRRPEISYKAQKMRQYRERIRATDPEKHLAEKERQRRE
nr:hypothetical protein BaRGS_008055 [Batillaria attramentaria]